MECIDVRAVKEKDELYITVNRTMQDGLSARASHFTWFAAACMSAIDREILGHEQGKHIYKSFESGLHESLIAGVV